jgi:hypothetical protein
MHDLFDTEVLPSSTDVRLSLALSLVLAFTLGERQTVAPQSFSNTSQ